MKKFAIIFSLIFFPLVAISAPTPNEALEKAVSVKNVYDIKKAIASGATNADELLVRQFARTNIPNWKVVKELMEGGAALDTRDIDPVAKTIRDMCDLKDFIKGGTPSGDYEEMIRYIIKKLYNGNWPGGKVPDSRKEIEQKCLIDMYEKYGYKKDTGKLLADLKTMDNSVAKAKIIELENKYKFVDIKKSDKNNWMAALSECDKILSAADHKTSTADGNAMLAGNMKCNARILDEVILKYYIGIIDIGHMGAFAETSIKSACGYDLQKCDMKKLSESAKVLRGSVKDFLENSDSLDKMNIKLRIVD